MADKTSTDKLNLGFLRIISIDSGYVGGLLVTNRIGRPLEFQCTTPVRPNKTQEVLYGPTLESFVYTEVLGKTLFERMAVKPDLLLIDQPQLLPIREQLSVPVVQLPIDPEKHGAEILDAAIIHEEFPQDTSTIELLRKIVPATADINEPLERVKDALAEALRTSA